jgi:neutral ceramidase
MAESKLLAGVAAIDITPPLGTHLSGSGMGEHRPAQHIFDPLHARALVLEDRVTGKRAGMVYLDLTILSDDWSAPIREAASKRLGIAQEDLIVGATQTHSSPSLGNCMLDPDFPLSVPPEMEYLRGGEVKYYRQAVDGAIKALEQAATKLEPVDLATGRSERPDLAFNRRNEHTIDPEVRVVGLRRTDGSLLSLLLHYTAHPVNVFCRGWNDKVAYHAVSADWCGEWAAQMAADHPGCVPIVINGCCGNINPGPYNETWDRDQVRHGRELAKTAREIVRGLEYSTPTSNGTGVLDCRRRIVPMDYRQVPAERLAEVEAILSKNPEPIWKDPQAVEPEWFYAASTRSIAHCQARWPKFPYEVQAWRVGDVGLACLPGEPFSEGQLDLKRRSPARATVVSHMTQQYVGYLPTREAYPRFGHEANEKCTYWAKLAPGSMEKAVDAAVELLDDLFTSGRRS